MENNMDLTALMQELVEENRAQKELLRKQRRATHLMGVLLACLVILAVLALFVLLPQINSTLGKLDTVLDNTQEITQQLKNADLEGTIASLEDALVSINGVMEECSDSLSITLQNLEDMDIETLNKAIEDLYNVVDPLASLVSLFSR